MLEIYWKDLTAEAQQRILDEFGENCNFDVFPIAVLGNDEEDNNALQDY